MRPPKVVGYTETNSLSTVNRKPLISIIPTNRRLKEDEADAVEISMQLIEKYRDLIQHATEGQNTEKLLEFDLEN